MDKKNFVFKIYPLSKEIGKTWFVLVTDAAGRKQKKYGKMAHYNTVPERLKEAKRIIAEMQKGTKIVTKQRTDLIYRLSEILEHKRPSIEKKSYQTYFCIIKRFTEWYREEIKQEKNINPAEYIRHMQVKDYHKNTIRKTAVLLKTFFNDLVENGFYQGNPFEKLKLRKIPGKSLLPFHPTQIVTLRNLINAKDPQLWEAIQFEFYLYFRPKEIRLLKIGHILFEENKICLTADIAKDNDNYLKVIPKPMQPMILKYKGCNPAHYIFSKNGKPGPEKLSTNNLATRHLKFRKLAGLSDRFALYSWVHTGIKMAVLAGIPIKQLQLQKGHSDLKMFDEYLKNLGVEDCTQLKNNFPGI